MRNHIKTLIGGIVPDKLGNPAVDRELMALRSRLNVESIGLRRAAIMARTQLIEEILKRPERPEK